MATVTEETDILIKSNSTYDVKRLMKSDQPDNSRKLHIATSISKMKTLLTFTGIIRMQMDCIIYVMATQIL
jgi:hypothetical protein